MPKLDPSFVRLRDGYQHSQISDIIEYGTLWTIAGQEVKPFPDPETDPVEVQFVRDLIRRGTLEEATQVEYDEQQVAAAMLARQHLAQVNYTQRIDERDSPQEAPLQDIVKATQRQIAKRREATGAVEGDDSEAEDQQTPQSATSPQSSKVSMKAGQS